MKSGETAYEEQNNATCVPDTGLLLALLTGCDRRQYEYRGIVFQTVEASHPADAIPVDNEWLQRKSAEAADGLDLHKEADFAEWLEKIDPIIERYFERYAKLTEVVRYSDEYWGLQYTVSPEYTVMGYAGLLYAVDPQDGALLVLME